MFKNLSVITRLCSAWPTFQQASNPTQWCIRNVTSVTHCRHCYIGHKRFAGFTRWSDAHPMMHNCSAQSIVNIFFALAASAINGFSIFVTRANAWFALAIIVKQLFQIIQSSAPRIICLSLCCHQHADTMMMDFFFLHHVRLENWSTSTNAPWQLGSHIELKKQRLSVNALMNPFNIAEHHWTLN